MTTAEDFTKDLLANRPTLAQRPSSDWPAFNCPVGELIDVFGELKTQRGYDMLVDATAIDNGVDASPRFTVVYHLYATAGHTYVRIAADLADDVNPVAPSAVALWAGADWHEREAYDMFGIRYDGHPDMRRILMWDEYPHFPLRKDFPLAGFEGELNDAEVAAETGTKVKPAAMAGGPFVAPQQSFASKREPRAKDESWSDRNEKPQQ